MMSFIRILLITFVLLLAVILGLKEDGRRWLKQTQLGQQYTQLTQALEVHPPEDRAGKPVFQR